MVKRFLAFDLGAESGRAMVASISTDDAGGHRLELAEAHRFPTRHGRLQGVLQWDLLGLWEEIKEGLRKGAKLAGERLDGVGVDTWGVDFALLDARGRVLGNPVHYRDRRTAEIMPKVFGSLGGSGGVEEGRRRLFAATGIQFMPFNTIFQMAALKENPEAVGLGGAAAEARRLLFMPDVLHYLLSGRAVNEVTIASTGALLDPRTRNWQTPLLQELGLQAAWLGELVPPGSKLGGVLPEVARETDCPAGTPVIAPASHDTASAVAAVPVTAGEAGGGWCYLSSGTWSLMGVEVAQPVVDDRTLRLNYTNEQGFGGTVRLLKNIMGLWLVQECRRDLARRGTELDYAELTRLAAEEKGLETLLDPWHPPFAEPGGMLGKIDQFARSTGQVVPQRPGQYVRACLDSLALTYRVVADHLAELIGHRIDTVHIVGGGTQNKLLNQMTADATGRRVVAGPVEATAIGNAITQAIGAGVLASLAQARAMVAASFTPETYQPREPEKFERALGGFRELCGL